MPRYPSVGFALVTCVLAGCALAAAATVVLSAWHDGAPANLIQTTHEYNDLLTSAQLKNFGKKRIISYTIGWAYVLPNRIDFHKGALMNVPAGIRPGGVHEVPDQAVPFNTKAERVIFFVEDLVFEDGSGWKSDKQNVRRMAAPAIPR